jgi:hypothetical protein
MPAASRLPVMSTVALVDDHPKSVLYNHAYDPLTEAWFNALNESPQVKALLDEAPRRDLVTTLQLFNGLFHALVNVSLESLYAKADDIVTIVSKRRNEVLWAGHMAPGADADNEQIRDSLRHKMMRNISLGVIEALICLESAYAFGRDELGLGGTALADVLQRSRQLYASLAVLHDEQERVRLTFLTGIDSHLMYPKVDYHDVIGGSVRIASDKFIVAGPPEARRLRFISPPAHSVQVDSPVKRCPAQRLRSAHHDGLTLNDVLWDLLIAIYRQSGRFA